MIDVQWLIQILIGGGGVTGLLGLIYQLYKSHDRQMKEIMKSLDKLNDEIVLIENFARVINHNSTIQVKALIKQGILTQDDIDKLELAGFPLKSEV
jgi:NADH dehydrogenase FAD-containing subunit